MAQKTGISAKNFQDTFGFGSYQTTWGWLHKLRSVMVVPGRGLLSGEVEVDETYVGGQKHGARGRGAEGKTPVLVAVEIREGKLGRCRFRACEDVKADTVMASNSQYGRPCFAAACSESPPYLVDSPFGGDFGVGRDLRARRFPGSRPVCELLLPVSLPVSRA